MKAPAPKPKQTEAVSDGARRERASDRGPHVEQREAGVDESPRQLAQGDRVSRVFGDSATQGVAVGDAAQRASATTAPAEGAGLADLLTQGPPLQRENGHESETDDPLAADYSETEEEESSLEAGAEFGDVGVDFVGKSVSFPLFGHDFTISPTNASASGSFPEKSFDVEGLPAVSLSFDLPVPGPIPAYATVGLEAGLSLGVKVGGTYEAGIADGVQSLSVVGEVSGSADLSVGATAGAGVGIANVTGIGMGVAFSTGAKADVTGELKGSMTRDAGTDWKTSNLSMTVGAKAGLFAEAGGYIEAKLLMLSAKKKFTFKEWELGVLDFERTRAIDKAGLALDDIKPTLADFRLGLGGLTYGDMYAEDDELAPLLGEQHALRAKALSQIQSLSKRVKGTQEELAGAQRGDRPLKWLRGPAPYLDQDKIERLGKELDKLEGDLAYVLEVYDDNRGSSEETDSKLVAKARKLLE